MAVNEVGSVPILLDAGDGGDSILVSDGVVRARGAELDVSAGALKDDRPDVAPCYLHGALRVDCRGARIRGGAVNAHTHLYSGLAPLGMPAPATPPESFVQILERVWWRLDRALDRDALAAAAELYIAEALLAGTTTLVDHHESPAFIEGSLDVLADAAQALGCRLMTGYGATDRNGGAEEGRRGLAECRRFARENRRPLVRPLVALHASFTVSDETVRAGAALCRELGVPMHVHMAEDAADVSDAKRRGYVGPLERLMTLGALPAGSILAHGVHLTEPEVRAADDAGLWLVHNPRSNAGNRVGYARSLGASRRVALGTDGYPADMRAEQGALSVESARAGQPLDRAAIDGRARAGHALASSLFGVRIEAEPSVGAAADLVVWRAGEEDVAGTAPMHVVVDGEVVVRDGRLVRGDIDAIRARAREEAPRLWERMRAIDSSAPGAT